MLMFSASKRHGCHVAVTYQTCQGGKCLNSLHRRTKGKRGGFATLVRKGITVQRHVANEYAQLLELTVPGGSHLAVVNCYLPPGNGMRRKRLSEEAAYDAVADLVVKVPHHKDLLLCGDLNARTGCMVPSLDPAHVADRVSSD